MKYQLSLYRVHAQGTLSNKPPMHFTEHGGVGAFQPFETNHFTAYDFSAVLLHPSQGQFLVARATGADCLVDDENAAPDL